MEDTREWLQYCQWYLVLREELPSCCWKSQQMVLVYGMILYKNIWTSKVKQAWRKEIKTHNVILILIWCMNRYDLVLYPSIKLWWKSLLMNSWETFGQQYQKLLVILHFYFVYRSVHVWWCVFQNKDVTNTLWWCVFLQVLFLISDELIYTLVIKHKINNVESIQ